MRAQVRGLLIVTVLALASAPARADDASEARLHNEMAQDLYQQRRFEEAIQHFLASNRLVPNAAVALNIARIYGVMERWIESYNWYETYLREFEVSDEDRARATAAQATVRPHVAVVEVASDPPGATLFVDRVELGSVGTAPRRVAIEAGAHTMIARLDAHHARSVPFTVTAAEQATLEVTLEPILGSIHVHSEPPGAAVVLAGREAPLGVTPLDVTVPVGEHRLTITHPGFSEVVRHVMVADGEAAALDVTLARLASNVSVLSVNAPAGAEVLIDDAPIGIAPLTADDLAPGTHRLLLRLDGREDFIDDLVLEAGGATRVSATLEDPGALHFEDLRVAGYALGGVTVLGGIALGVAGFVLRDQFLGSVNPSRADLDRVHDMSVAADVLWITGAVILAATLVADLAIGPRPHSRAEIVVDR